MGDVPNSSVNEVNELNSHTGVAPARTASAIPAPGPPRVAHAPNAHPTSAVSPRTTHKPARTRGSAENSSGDPTCAPSAACPPATITPTPTPVSVAIAVRPRRLCRATRASIPAATPPTRAPNTSNDIEELVSGTARRSPPRPEPPTRLDAEAEPPSPATSHGK